MKILVAALLGFLLDLLIGDPESLSGIHPVVLMGKAIRYLETFLRKLFPKTPVGEKLAGLLLALFLPTAVFFCSRGILQLLDRLWQPLAFAVEVIWCAQALAVKNLKDEAMRVHRALTSSSLEEARKAVGRIVGRDTDALDRAGVICAAVETVAENFSDGVIAPMAYMLLGGAPLALCYKAINTMDSMVGYKNDRYLHFGCFPARLDDIANFLPSRIAALILIAASALTGENVTAFINSIRLKEACRILRQQPNITITELSMEVGFNTPKYFTKLFKKEFGVSPSEYLTQEQV